MGSSMNGKKEDVCGNGADRVASEGFKRRHGKASVTGAAACSGANCENGIAPDVAAEGVSPGGECRKAKVDKEWTLKDIYGNPDDLDDDEDDSDWEPVREPAQEPVQVPDPAADNMRFCINCTMLIHRFDRRCWYCNEHKKSGILKHGFFASPRQKAGLTPVELQEIERCKESISSVPASECSTAVGFDERMLLHCEVEMKSSLHPERPDRLRAIAASLSTAGIFPGRCRPIAAREITQNELLKVHSADHIEAVEVTSAMVSSYFTSDTYANEHSARAARLAAGLCADLASEICSGRVKNGFALIRPPGHHAGVKDSSGFCLHNNAAIATLAAQAAGAKKILILDWDVHHGNGTQEIFNSVKSVLYISLHRYEGGTFYPRTGAAHEVGTKGAEGTCVNIPWSRGRIGDNDYIFAFQQVVLPIAQEFGPDFVIISAGFDAARGDPLGGCDVTPAGYACMANMLNALAGGKLLVILEGGYNLRSISSSATAVIKVLLGQRLEDKFDGVLPTKAGVQAVLEVLKIQMNFWPCLRSNFTKLQSHWESYLSDKKLTREVTLEIMNGRIFNLMVASKEAPSSERPRFIRAGPLVSSTKEGGADTDRGLLYSPRSQRKNKKASSGIEEGEVASPSPATEAGSGAKLIVGELEEMMDRDPSPGEGDGTQASSAGNGGSSHSRPTGNSSPQDFLPPGLEVEIGENSASLDAVSLYESENDAVDPHRGTETGKVLPDRGGYYVGRPWHGRLAAWRQIRKTLQHRSLKRVPLDSRSRNIDPDIECLLEGLMRIDIAKRRIEQAKKYMKQRKEEILALEARIENLGTSLAQRDIVIRDRDDRILALEKEMERLKLELSSSREESAGLVASLEKEKVEKKALASEVESLKASPPFGSASLEEEEFILNAYLRMKSGVIDEEDRGNYPKSVAGNPGREAVFDRTVAGFLSYAVNSVGKYLTLKMAAAAGRLRLDWPKLLNEYYSCFDKITKKEEKAKVALVGSNSQFVVENDIRSEGPSSDAPPRSKAHLISNDSSPPADVTTPSRSISKVGEKRKEPGSASPEQARSLTTRGRFKSVPGRVGDGKTAPYDPRKIMGKSSRAP